MELHLAAAVAVAVAELLLFNIWYIGFWHAHKSNLRERHVHVNFSGMRIFTVYIYIYRRMCRSIDRLTIWIY